MTAEVTALVEQWIPLARGLARKAGSRYPWLSDDFESAAGEALLKLAGSHGGDERFPRLIRGAVRWAILRRLEVERVRNPLAFRLRPDLRNDEGEQLDAVTLLADDAPPVGTEAEAADELRAVLDRAGLTERQRDVLVRFVGHDATPAELAAEAGVCHQRIRQVINAGLAKLQAAAEVPG